MKTMDIILIIVAVLVIAFTVTMILLFLRYAMVPDTLITCFYAAMAGECGIMGWIKTAKVRNQERKWMEEDLERAKQEEKGRDS
jgi:hypothetical protein